MTYIVKEEYQICPLNRQKIIELRRLMNSGQRLSISEPVALRKALDLAIQKEKERLKNAVK